MSTSELSDLEAVLEQVLPNPQAYAERVVEQLLDRLAATAPTEHTAGSPSTVIDQTLVERNTMLAAALGACECWGEDPGCPVCAGDGGAGWALPDPALYAAYVRPARRPRAPTTARASARQATDLDEVQPENGEST
jgi:hypothetical protein